jgi:hypothetical protein
MRDLHRLVQMATSNHGLLTLAQLCELDISGRRVSRLVAEGILERLHRGVFRLCGSPSTWEQRLLAAVCAPGPPRVASHRSALRLWGLRSDDAIEVTVRYPANCRLTGVVAHRSVDIIDDEVTVRNGISVTTVPRTLCDAGLLFPLGEVQRLVDHAVAIGLVAPAELIGVRRRVGEHGRNGVVTLESAVDGLPIGAEGAESGPEVRLLRLIAGAGLPAPTLQHTVRVENRSRRIDLSYPSIRLALEYDGTAPHTRVDRFVDDRRRQNALVDIGWTVLRYTNEELRDRPWVIVGQIRRQLAAQPPKPPDL